MKRTHNRLVVALWVFGFGFFAGIAQGKLGASFDETVELYGQPTSQFLKDEAPQRVSVWKVNGFTIRIEFRDGVADVMGVDSLAWNEGARNGMVRANLSVLPEFNTRVMPVDEKDGSQIVLFFDKLTGEALAAYNMKPRPNTESGAAIRMVLNRESSWYKRTFKK